MAHFLNWFNKCSFLCKGKSLLMPMCFLPCLMTIELSTAHTSLDLKSKSCLLNRQLGPAIFFETIVSNSFQHHWICSSSDLPLRSSGSAWMWAPLLGGDIAETAQLCGVMQMIWCECSIVFIVGVNYHKNTQQSFFKAPVHYETDLSLDLAHRCNPEQPSGKLLSKLPNDICIIWVTVNIPLHVLHMNL